MSGGASGGSKIWTVRGIPADLQSAVSVAAKAARLTLGEWTAAALTAALSAPEGGGAPDRQGELAARIDALEARLAGVERRSEAISSRGEGIQFRVDGLEHRTEGLENQLSRMLHRSDSFEGRAERAAAAPSVAPRAADSGEGPFTRGIGSRKRLTAVGEEELQRLLADGVDDATIAARLGIHKRIVWARRLTDSGGD